MEKKIKRLIVNASNLSNCWTNCEEKTQLDGCRLESFQA